MMDSSPLYDQPRHPVRLEKTYDWRQTPTPKSRTERPVKYYFIDFDLTHQYEEGKPAQEHPKYGGDHTVPEWKVRPQDACNPFAVDVYRLGNVVRENFTGVRLTVPMCCPVLT